MISGEKEMMSGETVEGERKTGRISGTIPGKVVSVQSHRGTPGKGTGLASSSQTYLSSQL